MCIGKWLATGRNKERGLELRAATGLRSACILEMLAHGPIVPLAHGPLVRLAHEPIAPLACGPTMLLARGIQYP